MAVTTTHCYVLGDDVTVISNQNGEVTNVVCPKFARLTHGCLKKGEDTGFIALVIKKASDQAFGTKGSCCEFAEPRRVLS